MTPTEKGRRRDALLYGFDTRLQLCDMIANRESDLEDARAENAKLRELVRDLWEACPADGYYCIYHCEHYDKESESHCKLEDRMRELGVD